VLELIDQVSWLHRSFASKTMSAGGVVRSFMREKTWRISSKSRWSPFSTEMFLRSTTMHRRLIRTFGDGFRRPPDRPEPIGNALLASRHVLVSLFVLTRNASSCRGLFRSPQETLSRLIRHFELFLLTDLLRSRLYWTWWRPARCARLQ